MAYYAGLDVSLEQTSVCVVDDGAAVVLERRVATDPAAIAACLAGLLEPPTRLLLREARDDVTCRRLMTVTSVLKDPAATKTEQPPPDRLKNKLSYVTLGDRGVDSKRVFSLK